MPCQHSIKEYMTTTWLWFCTVVVFSISFLSLSLFFCIFYEFAIMIEKNVKVVGNKGMKRRWKKKNRRKMSY